MMRNLKIMGLALVAVFAMSAMVASAASAHTPAEFTVAKAPATITANQLVNTQHKFTVTGQTVTCKKAEFQGEATATTLTSIKLAAHYTECEISGSGGFLSAEITGFATTHKEIGQKGKCWYRVDAAGSAALECNEADVTVDAPPCTVHVPAQSFASGVTFANQAGPPSDIVATFNITGIKATHTDGFLCPFGSSGEGTEAILEGESTVIAEVGSEQINGSWDATVK